MLQMRRCARAWKENSGGLAGTKFLLELRDHLDQYVTHRGETDRAYLVEGIRRGMPEAFALRRLEVNDVNRRGLASQERQMVVLDGGTRGDERVFVPQARRRGPNHIGQPGCR